MKKAFTLFEVILSIFILGIIISISSYGLFYLYKNYKEKNSIFYLQMQTKNTLSLIRNTLNNAIYPSIALDFKPLDSTMQKLENKSINFYKNHKEFISFNAFSLPCFSGFFEPKSLKIDKNITLALSNFSIQTLTKNPSCKLYKNKNLEILLTDDNFFIPKDFYNPIYKAKILAFNTLEIQAQIPQFLQNKQSAKISPKLYLLSKSQRLIFSKNHIHLQNEHEKIEILRAKDYEFFISQNKTGIFLKLCQKEKDYSFCEEDFVLNGEF